MPLADSFQGAQDAFGRFSTAFDGVATIKLEQNYRSVATIVDAASGLVSHNKGRLPKRVFTSNAPGVPIELIECRNEKCEASVVVRSLRELWARGVRPRDVAVLYRRSSTGVCMQAALSSQGVPFNMHACNIWEGKPLRDLTALLRLIVRGCPPAALLVPCHPSHAPIRLCTTDPAPHDPSEAPNPPGHLTATSCPRPSGVP